MLYDDDDDDERMSPIKELKSLLGGYFFEHPSSASEKFLDEALYTLEENGYLDNGVDEATLILIGKLFKISNDLSPTELNRVTEKIRT